MDRKVLSRLMICGSMLLTLAACSQDELAGQNEKLPEGAYPVEIGSVTVTGVSDGAQTRMAEDATDGTSSTFSSGDVIKVKLAGSLSDGTAYSSTGDYTVSSSLTAVTATTPAYWQSTNSGTVTAWFPADENITLSDQKTNLKYVVKTTAGNTVSYNSSTSLTFSHQLAKMSISITGDQADNVSSVELYSYTSCTNTEGTVSGSAEGWISMKKSVYTNTETGTRWEANVVPGYAITKVRINGSYEGKIASITPETGKLYSVEVEAYTKQAEIDLSTLKEAYVISDSKNYYFTGTGSYPIQVSGSGIVPTIYLNGVIMTVAGNNAIDIKGTANVGIVVSGSSNTVTSTTGAGIFVAEGSTVNISADGKDNVLKVTGGEGNSGIGGYISNVNTGACADCGNINISNITLYAESLDDSDYGFASPGIGSTGNASCQSITIDNAIVYAYASSDAYLYSAPAIGNGCPREDFETLPTIKISNSTIYAYRGEENEELSSGTNNADYIGWPDETDTDNSPANSSISVGTGGSVTSSTIYCYTGVDDTSVDKTVVYDANGNATTN
ncbi:MAG: fimbrillin family protein [Bacteroides sp.]|nr:fimbrillin family protein [Bacteroides sp.]